MPALPEARGPLSASLLQALRREPAAVSHPPVGVADPLADEDLHLALYCCYELHYRGFDGVDERWEWEPSLLAFRAGLEAAFEHGLRAVLGGPEAPDEPVEWALRRVADRDDGASVSRYVESDATAVEVAEFLVHRSAYNLKEADPHTWAIPRLEGAAKAALVEVQADEYGSGRAERMHARLFADVLTALGLDPAYGAYLDLVPGVTLATVNLMSLLGLHRRHRGAICGHLALFEMTSTVPNRRYGNGLRRLGFTAVGATEFFDEHVEADAVHECLALHDVAGRLAREEPALAGAIVWGARALAELDRRWGARLLTCWGEGRTSLRRPLPAERSARPVGGARGGEARELVGPVAERADP
jgi:hypothetical protein